jgi:hypothetical protein
MSTNGIIARAVGHEGQFKGRYHHWDSVPPNLGKTLVELYCGHFNRNLNEMLEVLLDLHPAGWSTINSKDFRLKPGYTLERVKYPSFVEGESEAAREVRLKAYWAHPDVRRPQCYCHGVRHEEAQEWSDADDTGASWAYVFEVIEDQKLLHVLARQKNEWTKKYQWAEVEQGRIELDSSDPIDWNVIECGPNFERCSHYAWYHNLQPKTSNLSTRAYLGLDPLDMHNVIAVIVNGKRFKVTGSGGRGDYYNQHRELSKGKRYSKDTWVAECKAGNGRGVQIGIGTYQGDKYVPAPGVTWVYPPIKDQERETLVSLKQSELFAS